MFDGVADVKELAVLHQEEVVLVCQILENFAWFVGPVIDLTKRKIQIQLTIVLKVLSPGLESVLNLAMIFKMDGTLNTYDVVVDFEAADFASNFLHQVFDLRKGGQVSSHAQVRLLLQHDSKEVGDRRTGSSARQPLLECEASWTNDLCKNKMIFCFQGLDYKKELSEQQPHYNVCCHVG